MSLTNTINKKGPNIDPWSTLQETDTSSEKLFPKLTAKDRLESYDLNQSTVCFEKPTACKVCKSTAWSIVSKTFFGSIRIMLVIFVKSVECFFLKIRLIEV